MRAVSLFRCDDSDFMRMETLQDSREVMSVGDVCCECGSSREHDVEKSDVLCGKILILLCVSAT